MCTRVTLIHRASSPEVRECRAATHEYQRRRVRREARRSDRAVGLEREGKTEFIRCWLVRVLSGIGTCREACLASLSDSIRGAPGEAINADYDKRVCGYLLAA